MKQLKYALLFSVMFTGINATEAKQEDVKDYGFEEFVQKTSPRDIKRISVFFDITQNEKSPEISEETFNVWEQIFNGFVECARSTPTIETQDPKTLEKFLEFFSLIYNNLDKLHGNIGISASTELYDDINNTTLNTSIAEDPFKEDFYEENTNLLDIDSSENKKE